MQRGSTAGIYQEKQTVAFPVITHHFIFNDGINIRYFFVG